MTCIYRTFGNPLEITNFDEIPMVNNFSCDEVRKFKDEWIKEFRKRNISEYTENLMDKDEYFESYKKELEDFLKKCKCYEVECKLADC